MNNTNVIIIGAGGHAKVVIDIILKEKEINKKPVNIIGILDDDKTKEEVFGIPVMGVINDIEFIKDRYENLKFIIAIGNNTVRKNISDRFNKFNLKYYIAIHPSVVIGNNVIIEDGTVVMARAIINPYAYIGKHCIINTNAVIEHDNIIESFVHISPSVSCAGNVTIKEGAHLGLNSSVIPGKTIGSFSVIGAGSVVIKDIPPQCTAVGVPAVIKSYQYNESRVAR